MINWNHNLPQPFCWVLIWQTAFLSPDDTAALHDTATLRNLLQSQRRVWFVPVMFGGFLSVLGGFQLGLLIIKQESVLHLFSSLSCRWFKDNRMNDVGRLLCALWRATTPYDLCDKSQAVFLHSWERTAMGGFSPDCRREFEPSTPLFCPVRSSPRVVSPPLLTDGVNRF